jgi:hypothetical protein
LNGRGGYQEYAIADAEVTAKVYIGSLSPVPFSPVLSIDPIGYIF